MKTYDVPKEFKGVFSLTKSSKNINKNNAPMKHKIKVVMLPTDDNSCIAMIGHSKIPSYLEDMYNRTSFCITQHLYITVSQDVEPIKDGDWFIHDGIIEGDSRTVKTVQKCYEDTIGNTYYEKDCRKIIATTDPKLLKEHDDSVPIPRMKSSGIAEIQQSFLKEFVANPDGEFEVEYEYNEDTLNEYNKEIDYKGHSDISLEDDIQLKLNQDNEVTITSVEVKMYSNSKQELIDLIQGFEPAWQQRVGYTVKLYIEDWIKENLK